jgi:hypothetical protein
VGDAILIDSGLYFDAKNGDAGCYGIYDAKEGRAYLFYSGG